MKVILFDGVCNLCNGLVNWIIDNDRKNLFRFASLQSDYGIAIVRQHGIIGNYMDTLVLDDEGVVYTRSTAVLQILKYLGGIYSLAFVFLIVPRVIRDGIYNYVAANRYKWFGKRETCRLPSEELKGKFIG